MQKKKRKTAEFINFSLFLRNDLYLQINYCSTFVYIYNCLYCTNLYLFINSSLFNNIHNNYSC